MKYGTKSADDMGPDAPVVGSACRMIVLADAPVILMDPGNVPSIQSLWMVFSSSIVLSAE